MITNSMLGGFSSGGIISLDYKGNIGLIGDKNHPFSYSAFSFMNGAILGPTISPVAGPFKESVGTGIYQRILEEANDRKMLE